MILILAPWHVFKRTVEVIWNFFAPGIFARLWLATFHRPVPSSPDLKDMMFFLTALALCTKRSARWQVESCMGHCLRVLIYRLVPLVSEFFATEYSKTSNMIDTGVRTWHVNTEQRHPPVYWAITCRCYLVSYVWSEQLCQQVRGLQSSMGSVAHLTKSYR